MKKASGILIGIIICGIFAVICVLAISYQKKTGERLNKMFIVQSELAYFEGQKDAIDGDVRIEKVKDNCYMWKKSPWDDGTHLYTNNRCLSTKIIHAVMKETK